MLAFSFLVFSPFCFSTAVLITVPTSKTCVRIYLQYVKSDTFDIYRMYYNSSDWYVDTCTWCNSSLDFLAAGDFRVVLFLFSLGILPLQDYWSLSCDHGLHFGDGQQPQRVN